MTKIDAKNFEDGKALNKALRSAVAVVSDLHLYNESPSQAVSELLSQLRSLLDHNESQADQLRQSCDDVRI